MRLPRVCVLGPLEVRRNGSPVAIGGERARRILALLVARRGRPIRIDVLADAAWDGAPPASWRNTLQSYLSRFRSSSGLRIERHADAYALDGGSCVVDADEFEQLCLGGVAASGSGQWGDAEHDLAAALEIWRGPAFDGFTDLDAVRPVAGRLEEQRLDAVESLVEAHLATESLNEAIVASTMARPGPVGRERLACLRATALHRLGRAAEALRELACYRRRLADETGLHPTTALVELEQRVLRQFEPDDVGRREVRLPVELERSRTTQLIGRDDQLREAVRAWRAVEQGGFAAMLLVGEAGAGKTRLAAEIAATVLEGGAAVRYGRATERLETAHRVFAHALRDVTPDALDTVGTLLPELFGVIPHLVVGGPTRSRLDDDDVHTTRFHEALGRLLAALAAERPLLLVLDDLHWSPASTIAVVEHLVTVGRPAGLMVLASTRSDEAAATASPVELANDLARRGDASVVDVAGLDASSVTALFAARGLILDEPLARHVHRATGGNPLLANELASSVESVDDLWLSAGAARLNVPATVTSLVRDRTRRLSDRGEVLSWAALIGVEFELAVLEQASGDVATLDHVEEAARAGLTREVDSGVWEFCHGLTRDAIVQQLSQSRTARRHADVARALEEERPPGDLLGRIAYHWCEAAASGDPDKALDCSIEAARMRLTQLAPDEARRHVSRALEVARLDPRPEPTTLATLYLIDAAACELLLDHDGRKASAELAFTHARRARDHRLVADAALLRNAFWTQGYLDQGALDCIDAALEMAGEDRTARTRLLASLAGMLAVSGARREETGHDPVELAEAALTFAEDTNRGDDGESWLSAATSLVVALWARPAAARQVALATEMQARAGADGPLFAARWGAAPALALGDRAAFERATGRLRDLDDGTGFDVLRAYGFQGACLSALLDGRFDDASDAGARAVSLARGHPNFTRVHLAQTFWIATETDALEPLVPAARAVVADNNELPVFHAMLGLILGATDQLDEARDILDRLAADAFETVPRDVLWTATIAACAELTAAVGAHEHVAPLQRLLAPYRHQFVVVAGGAFVFGAIDRFRAMLAAAGNEDDAAELFTDAAGAERRLRSAPLEARTLVWQLRMVGDDTGTVRQRLEQLCRGHDLPWASRAARTTGDWSRAMTST